MQVGYGDGDRSFCSGESKQQNHEPRALGQFTAAHGPGEGVREAASHGVLPEPLGMQGVELLGRRS